MNYPMLRKLRDELAAKNNRMSDEETLLQELISLSNILDKADFSLAMSSAYCSKCGQALKK